MPVAPAACASLVTGAEFPMPADPTVVSGSPPIVPCNALVCRACGAAVLHLDGVALRLGRGESHGMRYEALDPLGLLACGGFAPAYRAYACACEATSVVGAKVAAHLDTVDIDHWGCGGHPAPAARPRLAAWAEVLPSALAAHFAAGRWLVLDAAYEGLPDGRLRRHAWFAGEAEQVLAADQAAALVRRLGAHASRFVLRQVAPPRWTRDPLYGALREGWKHGDLDSRSFEGRYADAPALLQALRELQRRHGPSETVQYVAAPAVRCIDGWVSPTDLG